MDLEYLKRLEAQKAIDIEKSQDMTLYQEMVGYLQDSESRQEMVNDSKRYVLDRRVFHPDDVKLAMRTVAVAKGWEVRDD